MLWLWPKVMAKVCVYLGLPSTEFFFIPNANIGLRTLDDSLLLEYIALVDICGVTKVNGTLKKIVTQPFSFFHQQSSLYTRLYSKVWPMLSIFDSNKQKTPLEISVVFDRWGAVL
jgi:hypothetical protein